MSEQVPQSRCWRRRLVLHAICLECFDADYGLRRVVSISRIRAERLNMAEFEPCPYRWKVWHRRWVPAGQQD